MFFNATEMAKQFKKQPSDFLRLKPTEAYIAEILKDFEKDSSPLEKSSRDDLIRVVHGGKHSGTWMHKELFFEFCSWCSAPFRRKLHKWVDSRINEEYQRKLSRLESKTGFLPLTNAIANSHKELKPYHFSNECNLLNRLVTGMDAKKFKELHGVDSVRDALDAKEIKQMAELQRHDATLIELGFNYEQRKELLTKFTQQAA
jgi:hypothetical protein